MTGYLGDVAALARKDLLVELRTRDTVPASWLRAATHAGLFETRSLAA